MSGSLKPKAEVQKEVKAPAKKQPIAKKDQISKTDIKSNTKGAAEVKTPNNKLRTASPAKNEVKPKKSVTKSEAKVEETVPPSTDNVTVVNENPEKIENPIQTETKTETENQTTETKTETDPVEVTKPPVEITSEAEVTVS